MHLRNYIWSMSSCFKAKCKKIKSMDSSISSKKLYLNFQRIYPLLYGYCTNHLLLHLEAEIFGLHAGGHYFCYAMETFILLVSRNEKILVDSVCYFC